MGKHWEYVGPCVALYIHLVRGLIGAEHRPGRDSDILKGRREILAVGDDGNGNLLARMIECARVIPEPVYSAAG